MTFPALLMAALFASTYGALYHLVCGGNLKQLLLYLFLAWLGFALGHAVAEWRGWTFLQLGTINLGAGTVGSYLLLGLGDWLSRMQVRP